MDFTDDILRAFEKENDHTNPKTKDELLRRYHNVVYHKTHINDELFFIPKNNNKYLNIPENMRMVITCILIMIKHGNIYTINMHTSEIVSFDNRIIKKNFEYLGYIIKSNFQDSFNLMNFGVPIWPDRKVSNKVYPQFKLPNQEDIKVLINKKLKNKEIRKIKRAKRAKKNQEECIREEYIREEYIKKYGEFNVEEAVTFLRSRWDKVKNNIKI